MFDRPPEIVDPFGNIHIHGQEGIVIPIQPLLGDSFTGLAFEFRVNGLDAVSVPDDVDNPGSKKLTLTEQYIASLPSNQELFALVNTSETPDFVLWEGYIYRRGWS